MSPTELARKFVHLSSQSGKTTELINALPNERCAIMTASNDNAKALKKRIQEQRPEYNVDNIEFVTYVPGSGWRDKLLLREMHVYFDNDVLDDVIVHHVSAINQVYGKTITSV